MAEPQAAAAAGAAPRPRVVGFVNRLSGGQMGARVFEAAQKAGLDAVYDLSEGGPRCAGPIRMPTCLLLRDAATAPHAHAVRVRARGHRPAVRSNAVSPPHAWRRALDAPAMWVPQLTCCGNVACRAARA